MRAQPLIACRDVEASSRWYQRLLGCKSAHGGPEYERLVDPRRQRTEHGGEGLILQLHSWEVEHDHGAVGDPVEVDDFDAAAARATDLGAEVVLPVHRNPPEGPGGPAHRELWIKDLDGYTVVLASPDGEAA
jgi:catechol 2,3-dioxygenase-like lactoylglutathione lyase family enzyme